ncbi:IS110 family transposase [Prolixibacter denitrificans]|jgi:transposase|uniref:Transposase n=1 Tax=Prolixibacter denitrificans TaxID=1541063 RepID=A0A2P8C572_9BACT|nr:IS110 family transposase [Prolixibacter denitrificans]PSK80096.1 transposase [Prolixibacter denitrificans]
MQRESKTINFQGQNIYTGIDVHLKSWKVTVMIENVIYKTFSQDPDSRILANYLRKNFPGGQYYSAYEAGFCGYSVHRELVKQGIRNIVVNPSDIPTTDKEKKQKDDKRDSLKIAKSLKSGELEGIYVPSKGIEELRGLVRYRKTLVKEISRNKTRIKSFLHCNGIVIPSELNFASRYWSGKFTLWLKTIEMTTPYGDMVLQETLDTTDFLRKKLLKVTRSLRLLNTGNEYSAQLKLLQSIPGVGLIMAVTLLSELEDFRRFRKLDQLCSYVGLVPRTNSSGEKEKTGGITPRSNKPLRSCIVESAWIASRTDPALILCFNQLCQRMKPTEAIIRIAKKLLNRIRYVINNETEYVQAVV